MAENSSKSNHREEALRWSTTQRAIREKATLQTRTWNRHAIAQIIEASTSSTKQLAWICDARNTQIERVPKAQRDRGTQNQINSNQSRQSQQSHD